MVPGCNVVLSPRHVPSIQTDLNSGDMSRGQNFVPATRFFMKIERSHDGICPRDMSLQHVPSCEPTFILRWEVIILPILTTSLDTFLFKWLGECTF